MFYHKEQTTSTNDDARDAKYSHGDVIIANKQSAGRGQRGHTWISDKGLNATFSVVLEPLSMPAREQFIISQITALSIVDTLSEYGIDAKIKWTNDIYVGDKKICGILIENILTGMLLSRSIIGIGINVNQQIFDPSLPNPTSIILESLSNTQTPRNEIIEKIHASLLKWYDTPPQTIAQSYHNKMYRLGEWHTFRLPTNNETRGNIQGVAPSGALILQHEDGSQREYQFKEIEFVIANRPTTTF